MAAAITPRTRLIFVCNPNNPTGTVVHARRARATFLDQVPADCLVVLDEAYREYVRDPAVPDGIDLYRDRPNVAVLRTFSKAYGLAGLRVGLRDRARAGGRRGRGRSMLPFSVNTRRAGRRGGLAGRRGRAVRARGAHRRRSGSRVREALVADGWAVPPTEANFVWLHLGEHTPGLRRGLRRRRASPFARSPATAPGSAIGDAEANDAFLAVARAYPHRTLP